jgi:alkaline phosphatase D
VVVSVDAWDGFPGERRYIMDALRQAGTRNFTALTGDLHSYIVAYLKADYANRDNGDKANRAGVEFMTPAVTSTNLTEMFGVTPERPPNVGFPVAQQPTYYLEDLARAANPHIQFFNSQDHGYCTVEYTRSGCEYVAYRVDKTVNAFCPAREVIRRMRAEPDTGELTSLPF